jgi:hypothetical protein
MKKQHKDSSGKLDVTLPYDPIIPLSRYLPTMSERKDWRGIHLYIRIHSNLFTTAIDL